MNASDRGVSLAEMTAVLAVLGLVFTMSVPALWEILAEEALGTASREVAGILTAARARAVFQGAEVGVRWVANAGDLVLTVYQDGNGNGVTTADIRKGVDRLVAGPYWLGSRYPGVNFSFVPGMDGADPGWRADRRRVGPGPVREVEHLLVLARSGTRRRAPCTSRTASAARPPSASRP